VLIADGGAVASRAAAALRPVELPDSPTGATEIPQILGSELWSGEKIVATTPALDGAWFAAVSDERFGQFSESYRSRFGTQPYRIATLGYDSVLLTLRVAREWTPGAIFPTERLYDPGGFLGVDGAFRFQRNGVIQRSLEVREVHTGTVRVISPAPSRFETQD
jgi:hypothetical protein